MLGRCVLKGNVRNYVDVYKLLTDFHPSVFDEERWKLFFFKKITFSAIATP